ncbi:hypothetical protein HPB50_010039 [Hyalomma asiaticum]|uniref:Uncharacterized protein n=1 Tax=Hyalomma asiaticum TaxID=266040 RepID=A0ACB7RZQ6_HYAAI|nr:hypothetical protein HPB50_010039 [Hyalomma asiaticum]
MEYLMPSEVARLVLGYLKSTGCHSTWETFLRESADLKEYADSYIEFCMLVFYHQVFILLSMPNTLTAVHNSCASSGELLPNLQNLSAQLNDVLARLQSAQPENNAPAAAPTNGNEAHSSNSTTTALPQQPYHADQQPTQPLMLTTQSGYPPLHHPSSSPQQERRHPHPGGDTLSYHVHTHHLPPLPLLPPSITSVLKHGPPTKQLPGGLERFEPPEKDIGMAPHSCSNPVKATALGCCYPQPPEHIAAPQLGAFDDRFLAYLNPFPRPLYPRHPYIGDEEPVRDSGIDLRKRPQEASSDRHSSDARPSSPSGNEASNLAEKETSYGCGPGSDPLHYAADRQDGGHEDQCDGTPTDEPMLSTEPVSEGFEVSSEAAVETQTEVSEEIDVDGSSRGPSPAYEEAGTSAAALGCAVSAASVVATTSAPAPSPRLMATSFAQQTPDHPPTSENSTMFETPENTGVPPLPSRFPDPDSPRAILSEARSLQPSLTTPVKAVRFDPERFYSPRRKSLIPRRRLLVGFSPSCKHATTDSGNTNSSTEENREFSALLDELVHNYPFVTKLAENINQAVVGPDGVCTEGTVSRLEPIAEESPIETGDSLTSQETSMPDSLIKEILHKTENDPVFEAALAQICEKLDTTNEVHGVLVTPSKSCSKSRQRKEDCSPKTPTNSHRRPQSQPTTPQLMRLFTSPHKSPRRSPQKTPQKSPHMSPEVSPKASPYVFLHRSSNVSPNASSCMPSSVSPKVSPNMSSNVSSRILPHVSPPATPPRRSPRIHARHYKQLQRPAPAATTTGPVESTENVGSTQSKAPLGTRVKPKPAPQMAKVTPVNESSNKTPPAERPAEPPSKLPLPPKPTNKSPFKVPLDVTTFKVPVTLPLKPLAPKATQSPLKPTVQVVSKSTENGQTVTCISIPDPPGPSECPPPKQCLTLADVIDSVLSPERRQALSQTESVASPQPLPVASSSSQSPVIIMSEGGQVMLCANNGMTSGLQTLAPSSLLTNAATPTISNIIYPNVMVNGMPSLGTFSIVMPTTVPVSSNCQFITMNGRTTTVTTQSGAPVAKKRLPLLQPREPLPSQPSPPAAFKHVEEPKHRYVMGNRLRESKLFRELLNQGASSEGSGQSQVNVNSSSNSATLQPPTTAPSSLSATRPQQAAAKPRTPPRGSPRLNATSASSNEKSPQLKSLVAVASKCTTSRNHVRVLDFGGGGAGSSEHTPGSSGGDSNNPSSEHLVQTIETIRTSLTGAVNRVLRNNTEGSSGLGSSKKRRKETSHFVICAAGIMAVFLGYGYTLELMFHIDGFKPHGFFLTFVQFVLCGIFAAPLRTHLLLSVLSVGTIGLSNASLGYLNYPTEVLFKCCKLIPVLLGGVLIQGVAMISTALLFDAAIGNVQEKAMTTYGTSNSEIMVFSYSIGSVILFFILAAMQDLTPAVKFFAHNPVETYGYAAIFSILGYLGIQLVLTLISISGAFVTVIVTTFRKALSIILSFMLFAKPFSFQYVWSGTLVLLGVYIHAYSKKLAKLQLRLPLIHQEKQFS